MKIADYINLALTLFIKPKNTTKYKVRITHRLGLGF